MTTELKMIVLRSLFDWMAAMPTYWSSNFLVLGLYSSLLIESLIYPSKKKKKNQLIMLISVISISQNVYIKYMCNQ